MPEKEEFDTQNFKSLRFLFVLLCICNENFSCTSPKYIQKNLLLLLELYLRTGELKSAENKHQGKIG